MTYKTLDHYQKRYKELHSILEKLQQDHEKKWSVRKGTDIDVKQLDENLPLDFKAFFECFWGR